MEIRDRNGDLIATSNPPDSRIFDQMTIRNAFLANCELEGISFDGADLSGSDFSGADLYWANLTDARFDSCNLANADF
ncbi:MAG: pentapeptide repeat-containing protein [Acidobacteriaceae bacterium]